MKCFFTGSFVAELIVPTRWVAQVCSYFKDPLICIGPVAAAQVKDDVEHTAGEKRLTAKTSAAVAAFNHLRRRK